MQRYPSPSFLVQSSAVQISVTQTDEEQFLLFLLRGNRTLPLSFRNHFLNSQKIFIRRRSQQQQHDTKKKSDNDSAVCEPQWPSFGSRATKGEIQSERKKCCCRRPYFERFFSFSPVLSGNLFIHEPYRMTVWNICNTFWDGECSESGTEPSRNEKRDRKNTKNKYAEIYTSGKR